MKSEAEIGERPVIVSPSCDEGTVGVVLPSIPVTPVFSKREETHGDANREQMVMRKREWDERMSYRSEGPSLPWDGQGMHVGKGM